MNNPFSSTKDGLEDSVVMSCTQGMNQQQQKQQKQKQGHDSDVPQSVEHDVSSGPPTTIGSMQSIGVQLQQSLKQPILESEPQLLPPIDSAQTKPMQKMQNVTTTTSISSCDAATTNTLDENHDHDKAKYDSESNHHKCVENNNNIKDSNNDNNSDSNNEVDSISNGQSTVPPLTKSTLLRKPWETQQHRHETSNNVSDYNDEYIISRGLGLRQSGIISEPLIHPWQRNDHCDSENSKLGRESLNYYEVLEESNSHDPSRNSNQFSLDGSVTSYLNSSGLLEKLEKSLCKQRHVDVSTSFTNNSTTDDTVSEVEDYGYSNFISSDYTYSPAEKNDTEIGENELEGVKKVNTFLDEGIILNSSTDRENMNCIIDHDDKKINKKQSGMNFIQKFQQTAINGAETLLSPVLHARSGLSDHIPTTKVNDTTNVDDCVKDPNPSHPGQQSSMEKFVSMEKISCFAGKITGNTLSNVWKHNDR